MKKITDFIVEKKYYILVIVIILSSISLYIGTKVEINSDISKYLPSDSETRIGMDIMEDNFSPIKESSLSVMFKDLDDEEKEDIKNDLEDIKNVSSVLYDETDEYNKDGYTLYILNVEDTSDSKTAKSVYDDVNKKFNKDYKIYLGGSIEDYNKPVLHFWIVILAICFAMLILIIMCDSYVEPFLFLFAILLAVGLNKGTNIIFPNVSHVTNAISAILQMALSMDYSIMLMNRYTQEKQKEKNKDKAMKKALYNSFSSISSSSVTTIVGLLALVFMSFTIGKDLGFVLAKGVLFSLLTIFLCLPALILLFDNLITKTKKKSLEINLNWLGKFSYKFRYIIFGIFLIMFVGSFIIKGRLNILYTDIETDEIGKHFNENNQMAIIYNNKYEDEITKYCKNLKDDKVTSVLCYGNTINDEILYEDLNNKLNELGNDNEIENYLLKVIYYKYYVDEEDNKMSLNEFITFVKTDIYKNEDLKEKIDDKSKDSINKLSYFSNKEEINKKRTSKEIAKILDIDESLVSSLFVLYNSNNVNSKIKIDNFITFINSNVLTNQTYSSMISKDNKEMINKVLPFIDKKTINKELNSDELSKLFGINKDSVEGLLLLNYVSLANTNKMSLDELIIKTSLLKNNTNYLDSYDVSLLTNLEIIDKNENNINSLSMNKTMLSNYFGTLLVDSVYNGAGLPNNYEMTPLGFIDFTLTNLGSNLDENTIKQLQLLKLLISSTLTNDKPTYTVSELSNLLSYDQKVINSLYALIDVSSGKKLSASPINFVNIILNNKDNQIVSSSLNNELINNLKLLKTIMNSINNDKGYTSKEMSNLLGIKNSDINLLYSLYEVTVLNKNVNVSLNTFTNYLINNVMNDNKYNSKFDNNSKDNLKTVRNILDNSLNNKIYNSNDLYNLLKPLDKDINKNLLDLVYIYEGSVNDYDDSWALTVENFVTYLHDDILKDERFDDFIDSKMKNDINKSYSDIISAKDLLKGDKYSRMIINTTYLLENDETFDFVKSIQEDLESEDKEIYVIGDSPMAYDMSKSFNSELNFITILTMLFIFVVVAITFKSLIVPLILVLIIQCAVYVTMSSMVLTSGDVYFIALLIVQSILMGATIDYAIVYTSYYKESRLTMDIKESIINAYNKSIHTILTSASILIIVTLVVAKFATAIAAKICSTLSRGTFCSVLLILFVLPSVLVTFDKLIIKNKKN